MCARQYELPQGDFPDLEPFWQVLLEIKDLSKVHKLDKNMVKEMDQVFSVDIPNLLKTAKYGYSEGVRGGGGRGGEYDVNFLCNL